MWGSSFPFMKVAVTGISPAQVAWTRILLGALTLGAIVLLRREHVSRSLRVWGHLLVLGLTLCVIPFLLFSWAQQHVSSGVASIFNATTPIMTAIMAWPLAQDRLRRRARLTTCGPPATEGGCRSSSPRHPPSVGIRPAARPAAPARW